jgi:hypothetical protein
VTIAASASKYAVYRKTKPNRKQRRACNVERDSIWPRWFLHPTSEEQDEYNHEDFTDKHPAPGEVSRREAADERTECHGDCSGAHYQSERPRTAFHRNVGRDQSHHGRQDHRRANAFEERPAEDQYRQVGGHGCR